MKNNSLYSMTGFSTAEGTIDGRPFRIEIKSLNHRFLDIKVRLPRELSGFENLVRTTAQTLLVRGSIEIKIERLTENVETEAVTTDPRSHFNLELAKKYKDLLLDFCRKTGISETLTLKDILSMPDVVQINIPEAVVFSELQLDAISKEIDALCKTGMSKLIQMRAQEGSALATVFSTALAELQTRIERLRMLRDQSLQTTQARIREKVQRIFDTYAPNFQTIDWKSLDASSSAGASTAMKALLESRIAQELALIVDRSDIEEELTRFTGHIDHFKKVLEQGGQAGRKLEFILQELNREINTLGNKAQDLALSEDVVQMKVRLEQLREQILNIL